NVLDQRAAQRVGQGITSSEVQNAIDISSNPSADVIEVKATTSSPERSAAIANAFAAEFVDFRAEADRAKVDQALAHVQQLLADPSISSSRQASLQSRSDQLQTLADLQTGGVELVERAEVPSSPSSPKVIRN